MAQVCCIVLAQVSASYMSTNRGEGEGAKGLSWHCAKLVGEKETRDTNKLNEFQADTMAHYVAAINLWQLYSNYPALIEKFLSAPQSA